jgi:hypothetical protein
MKFGQALEALWNGKLICRVSSNRSGTVIGMQAPTGKITEPFLYQQAANGECVVFTPTQGDLLAEDWILAPEAGKMAASQTQAANENAPRQNVQEPVHAG